MKPRDLSVKRQPVKRGLLRTLYAKLNKIKRPAATAVADPTELNGDIPRMNVGRSLLVIVALHIVCVAGIFAQKYFENKNPTPDPKAPGSAPLVALQSDHRDATTALSRPQDLPQPRPGDDRHMVIAGDSYASIARKWNISEQSLRAANNDVNICTGLVLRVPPREIIAHEPQNLQGPRNGGNPQGASPRAILVRPNINLDNAPRAIPINDEAPQGGKSYVAQKGDTFSKIGRTHGISAAQLMKANGITNDRSLRIGQKLIIPDNKH
jgi:LysM repeat protein